MNLLAQCIFTFSEGEDGRGMESRSHTWTSMLENGALPSTPKCVCRKMSYIIKLNLIKHP